MLTNLKQMTYESQSEHLTSIQFVAWKGTIHLQLEMKIHSQFEKRLHTVTYKHILGGAGLIHKSPNNPSTTVDWTTLRYRVTGRNIMLRERRAEREFTADAGRRVTRKRPSSRGKARENTATLSMGEEQGNGSIRLV
jgi:hypothetical protein